ncbi:MAG: ParB/RepB/Spo0J family partition protein [Rhodobacteraceae bacterium]|nr:ParB/RepB/Spo0J family partition protein [Paracoccaceae bacterium]
MADVNLGAADDVRAGPQRQELRVPIERLVPNPDQPRRHFEPDQLQDLADSIREKGVIQPLIVRAHGAEGNFEIVAGERRWRAAQIAQLHELPVIVREFSDSEVLEIAIIENIQRADLNAIEEAAAYRQLMQRYGHTQDMIAQALSRSRSHIANLLRLLALPQDVQDMVKAGSISAGHARALISTENASELARQVLAKGLSVRDTEALVRKQGGKPNADRRPRQREEKDADTRALEGDLSANLKMAVRIDHEPGGVGGKLSITYRSLEDLDLLCRALSLIPRDMGD